MNALTYLASGVVISTGLLFAGASYAQSDLSPAKSNCDSKTGCANYSTGDQTTKNPLQTSNSNAPYDQNGTNPAQSNCDSKTGCASYATGDQTKANPKAPAQ